MFIDILEYSGCWRQNEEFHMTFPWNHNQHKDWKSIKTDYWDELNWVKILCLNNTDMRLSFESERLINSLIVLGYALSVFSSQN